MWQCLVVDLAGQGFVVIVATQRADVTFFPFVLKKSLRAAPIVDLAFPAPRLLSALSPRVASSALL